MGEKIKIITPEYVELEYELAGIGSRLMAVVLDALIQFAILVGLQILALIMQLDSWPFSQSAMSSVALAIMTIVTFLVVYAYYIFFEVQNNGQTPGKAKMRLRVIRETGHPIDLQSSMIRNVVRIVDYLFALGFFVMFISKRSKRLGDYAARTVVVKERVDEDFEYVSPRPKLRTYKETYRLLDDMALSKISRISKQDYERIAHFLERIGQVRGTMSEDVARKLAVPIMGVLEIDLDGGQSMRYEYEAFLWEVARAYERHMGQ